MCMLTAKHHQAMKPRTGRVNHDEKCWSHCGVESWLSDVDHIVSVIWKTFSWFNNGIFLKTVLTKQLYT